MKTKKIKLKKITDEFVENDIITPTEADSVELLNSLKETESGLQILYEELAESDEPENYEKNVIAKIRSYKRASANILKAYYKVLNFNNELSARWNDLIKGKNRKIIPAAPANAVIDLAERRSGHFAQGLNIYKLLLLCYIGSFAGVIIEMLWCLLTRGRIESRAGLVYGPFNLLYGGAAVILTLALYRFRNKGKWISFFCGMIVGSGVEYICSWGQEVIFGSRSWDYSRMPFNINGRICLLYSAFWGMLSVLWVKSLYPWAAKLILKIPERFGKIFTRVVAAFFV